MAHIDFDCNGEHHVDLNIPDRAFDNGPLVVPCPLCERKYIVTIKGGHKPYKHGILRFPALHY